jgi:methyl coenzyme M reductase alpha subunit
MYLIQHYHKMIVYKGKIVSFTEYNELIALEKERNRIADEISDKIIANIQKQFSETKEQFKTKNHVSKMSNL